MQPQGKLEVNRRILEAYVPYIRKFKRQFRAFSAAQDVTNRLQEIKWTVENVIYFSQVIQRVLMKVSDFSAILRSSWFSAGPFFGCQIQMDKVSFYKMLLSTKAVTAAIM